jgi:hypothetical protein
MPFFFLPEQHSLRVDSLPDGRYYTKGWNLYSNLIPVPHGCVPVWCAHDFSSEDPSWTNPISGRVYKTHPLGLRMQDGSFFDEFYEISAIEGLTFGEGEAWRPDTNQKIRVEKTDAQSVWNPFFQRYDPPCDRDTYDCDPHRIKYDFVNESFHEIFIENMTIFYEVYCTCCRCEHCSEIHEGTCAKMCGL